MKIWRKFELHSHSFQFDSKIYCFAAQHQQAALGIAQSSGCQPLMQGILEIILLLSRHHASETRSVPIGGTVAQAMVISLKLVSALADGRSLSLYECLQQRRVKETKHIKIMFLNCHCIREEKRFYWSLLKLFTVRFVFILF